MFAIRRIPLPLNAPGCIAQAVAPPLKVAFFHDIARGAKLCFTCAWGVVFAIGLMVVEHEPSPVNLAGRYCS